MCTTCGCGGNHSHIHAHTDENNNITIHAGEDGHDHDHHHHDEGSRTISVEEDILARNNADAAKNRAFFASRGILALNFVSSPGSGKTELLAATIRRADPKKLPITVIEGDQETNNDADRIRSAGARSVQINTGKGCHLDAAMVAHALEHLNPEPGSACLIENVGNLVCPAEFDLGEAHKVVVISVTEGADKPLKYPDMFRAADLMLINKIDLLPYVDFDIDKCEEYARRVNPKIRSMRVSATKGDGLERWIKWLEAELTLASL